MKFKTNEILKELFIFSKGNNSGDGVPENLRNFINLKKFLI